jgi:hypothetical protein
MADEQDEEGVFLLTEKAMGCIAFARHMEGRLREVHAITLRYLPEAAPRAFQVCVVWQQPDRFGQLGVIYAGESFSEAWMECMLAELEEKAPESEQDRQARKLADRVLDRRPRH